MGSVLRYCQRVVPFGNATLKAKFDQKNNEYKSRVLHVSATRLAGKRRGVPTRVGDLDEASLFRAPTTAPHRTQKEGHHPGPLATGSRVHPTRPRAMGSGDKSLPRSRSVYHPAGSSVTSAHMFTSCTGGQNSG